mmetsp:Transcript_3103/g.11889  ORF Transcript_3103/g.11889 Transcript_3103/m.11889 type:complete len:205 (+) Transcript_3103:157-771(+)
MSTRGIYDDADLNKPIINTDDLERGAHRSYRTSNRPSEGGSHEAPVKLPSNASTDLFFTGLHWSVTDALMESMARQYGDTLEISFVEDKMNGKSKGICLIKFASPEQAYRAKLAVDGQQITEESTKTRCYFPSELPSAESMDTHGSYRGHGGFSRRERSIPPSFSTDMLDDKRHGKRPRDSYDDRYSKRTRRSRTPLDHRGGRY